MGGAVMDAATTEQMSSTTNVVTKTMSDTRRQAWTDQRCGPRHVSVLRSDEGFLDVTNTGASVGFVVVEALEREVEDELGVTSVVERLVERGEEVEGTIGSTAVAFLAGGDALCLIRPPGGGPDIEVVESETAGSTVAGDEGYTPAPSLLVTRDTHQLWARQRQGGRR